MATTFADDLRRFTLKLNTRDDNIFRGVVDECLVSIVEGSDLTGAPGQPVDTGVLKASWRKEYDSPTSAAVYTTGVGYAPYIEDGGNSRGPFTLRSEVGGFFSVALTVAGFPRIVESVTEAVGGGS